MARERDSINHATKRHLAVLILLFIPRMLILIGDSVLQALSVIWQTIKKSYSLARAALSRLSLPRIRLAQPRPPAPAATVRTEAGPGARTVFASTPAPSRRLLPTLLGLPLRPLAWLLKLLNAPWRFLLRRIKRSQFRTTPPKLTQLRRLRPAAKAALPKSVVLYQAPYTIRHRQSSLFFSFLAGSITTAFILFVPYVLYLWFVSLPSPYILSSRSVDVTTKIFDRNGTLLYEMYADQNRTPLKLSDIPDHVKNATIAIEDRDFYKHQGFSLRAIGRAFRETVFNKRLQGGSTITQQLIKSTLLTPEVKVSRKIKEVVLAFWSERIYNKNLILEMYLNQVPYGGTAWGIEAASQTYFAKSVKDVNLAEAALLAGLPAAPTDYSPFGTNPQMAYVRQHEVLRRMVEDGYITQQQAQEAIDQQLTFAQPKTPIRAPHFVLYVKSLIEQKYGTRAVERGGLRIITSLDLSLQEKAQEIVRTQIDSLARLKVGNGAAVITNPATGEILAMVGSRDYFDTARDGNVNVTTSLRQPGSSIKVVNYVAALENGFTAASLLDDSPVVYRTPGSAPYAPVNYDGRYHGPTPLRYALGNSYNIPAVRVLNKIGVNTMIETGKAMGINSWDSEKSRFGLSLTLGGGEVTMLEMAEVYGTLANNGRHIDLTPILEITDYTGRTVERAKAQPGTQAVRPGASWIISNILSDNVARTAAFGPNSSLVIPGKTVSVKTGTSNDKRDNWTIGYTPSAVVTVWVGNNDNSPMDPYLTSGVTGAAPIWRALMLEALKDRPTEVQAQPDDVVAVPCYFGRVEYFIKGTQPAGACSTLPPSGSPTPPVNQTRT